MPAPANVLFDILLESVSGIIAFYVAYRSFNAYDFSEEPTFLTFSLSFSILGASNIMRNLLIITLLLASGRSNPVRPYSLLADALQASASALSYALLLWRQSSSYLGHKEEHRQIVGQILLITLTFSFNILNVLILLMMTLIVFLRYSKDKEMNQLLVAGSFLFLAASHLSNLLGSMAPQLLIIENSLRLFGYFLLLVMIGRVGRK